MIFLLLDDVAEKQYAANVDRGDLVRHIGRIGRRDCDYIYYTRPATVGDDLLHAAFEESWEARGSLNERAERKIGLIVGYSEPDIDAWIVKQKNVMS